MTTRKKKPALQVKLAVTSASCSIYASFPMVCPMCQIAVPANTKHTCGDSSTRQAVDAIVDALGDRRRRS